MHVNVGEQSRVSASSAVLSRESLPSIPTNADSQPTGLNVCMISYSTYELDNRVIRYAETLAKAGNHVDVLALAQEAGGSFEEEIEGVNLFRIQRRTRRERNQLSYLVRILLFFLRSMFFLAWRQRKVRYDIVHVHSVPDFLVYAAWLPKMRGAKVILDIHDVLPEFYGSKFRAKKDSFIFKALLMVERASAHFADHVIIANHIWREKLISRSVAPEKCTAILNYPDRNIFKPRGRARNDGKFIITYPGTLNWHQGLDIAICAFDKIKDKAPQAEFHIYGSGPTQDQLKKLAQELGLGERVKFHGSRRLREIAAEIENADLGVVPKRNDGFGDEAFSTKTLEFMSLGVPVVVSDTKIDRYYFDDSTVKFFQAGNADSLAEAMLFLIQNQAFRCLLTENGLKFVNINDWDSNKDIYLNIIRQFSPQNQGKFRAA
jgi:glycosyltransferase involved in cell wall biosynthesis